MDEKQLNYEFLSIPGESHPGLTFEEYRDACVFLLFYHYLCLRFGDELEDSYKLGALVRMAVRGKLQIPSFLRFMESASSFIRLAGGRFSLTDFSFYRSLTKMQSTEKQKSYARFVRKLIKKMNLWDCDALLLEKYPFLFEKLLETFAAMKKETSLSEEMRSLYRLFFSQTCPCPERVFVPDFEYGMLFHTMTGQPERTDFSGCDSHEGYREIVRIAGYMRGFSERSMHMYGREEWEEVSEMAGGFDSIGIFLPEGVESGRLMVSNTQSLRMMDRIGSIAKGELPFLLSAYSVLREGGVLAAVLPGALLYREGKESQLRRFLVQEQNALDTVMLLPDHILQAAGQKEVLLLLRKNRSRKDVMFFDCSEMESFGEEQLGTIQLAWKERKTIPGFCSRAEQADLEKNEFNLNFPRYIIKNVKITKVDIEARKKRIAEIDRELEEIDKRIAMYKRDLEL